MIIGLLENGNKCVYDLPTEIKTAAELKSLIYGYNNGRMAESQREELYNQPKLKGLNGPMWNGWGTLKSTGETEKDLQLVIIKAVYFMNLTINNLIKGVQSAPFLACLGFSWFNSSRKH